jgi:nitrogen fixation protein FixH
MTERTSAWFWPAFVICLLLLPVAAAVILVRHAVSDESFAVEEDHYAKALAFDEHLARERASAKLGWTLQLDALPSAGGATISARLLGLDGKSVEGLELTYEAFHLARGSEILRGTLVATAGGGHEGTLPMFRPGLWEFRLRAGRGKERWQGRTRLDFMADGGAT